MKKHAQTLAPMRAFGRFYTMAWLCFGLSLGMLAVLFSVGCSAPAITPDEVKETAGTQVKFLTNGDWKTNKTFFDFPYPSDIRLNAQGGPDVTGFLSKNDLARNVLPIVGQRKGFPVIPVAYFRFSGAVGAALKVGAPIPAALTSPVFLIDIDDASPKKGSLYPTTARAMEAGNYTPTHVVAISPYQGIVLSPKRRYAFVVMRGLNDDAGKPLGIPRSLNLSKAGFAPEGAQGEAIHKLYAPLWEVLKAQKVDLANVAAATVFTTGDVVAESFRISEALRQQHKPQIKDMKLDPDDGDHPRYCEIHATITQPQFQKGVPPFDTEGLFVMDSKGIPVKQRDKKLPVVLTIPKKPMPKDGYPMMMYVHGSGGLSGQAVDRGFRNTKNGPAKKGEGPSHVVAAFGISTATSAMPVNPERVKGASAFSYLNIQNPAAFRDTFRQGVFETRMLIDALSTLSIPPSALGKCKGGALPSGVTAYKYDIKRLVMMGQSMGAMYTNMIAAVEPRIKAVIPTGAGGYWSYFAINNNVALLDEGLLRGLMNSKEKLTYMHPMMHLLQTAWEPAEPLIHIPRLSLEPLPKHPVRHVFQPAGAGDSYFPEVILDILSLAYGNQQAGKAVWPQMQERLKVLKLDGVANYPVKNNRKSGETPWTGVVAQYKPDDISKDGHVIAFQLNDVIYQYGCFVDVFVRTGKAIVPAPAKLGTPCPE